MIKVPKLNPGDAIVNRDPYPGEGEKLFAGYDFKDNQIKTITALCTKYPTNNGQIVPIDFDIVFSSYVMADTGKEIPAEMVDPSNPVGSKIANMISDDLNRIKSEIDEEIREHKNFVDAANYSLRLEASGQLKCTCGGQRAYRKGDYVYCFECDKLKGSLSEFILTMPYNPNVDGQRKPIKFTIDKTSYDKIQLPGSIMELPVGTYTYKGSQEEPKVPLEIRWIRHGEFDCLGWRFGFILNPGHIEIIPSINIKWRPWSIRGIAVAFLCFIFQANRL